MGRKSNLSRNGYDGVVKNGSSAPKSLPLSEAFEPGGKFNAIQAKLAADVISGRLEASRMNAARGAYSNILRMLDLQYKYAKITGQTGTIKRLEKATK